MSLLYKCDPDQLPQLTPLCDNMNRALLAASVLLTIILPAVLADGYGHGHGYGEFLNT